MRKTPALHFDSRSYPVHDPKFQDRVVAETRALLGTTFDRSVIL